MATFVVTLAASVLVVLVVAGGARALPTLLDDLDREIGHVQEHAADDAKAAAAHPCAAATDAARSASDEVPDGQDPSKHPLDGVLVEFHEGAAYGADLLDSYCAAVLARLP